jgi:hypothetical protein
MRQASQKLAMGDSISALTAYNDRGFVHEYATQDRAIEATCQSWWKNRQRGKDVTATMATFMRKDVEALNTCARVFMRDSGKLKKDVHLKIHDGRNEVARAFAVGDEIYFLKGDSRLNVAGINEEKKGVKNGTRGVITALTKRRVVVKLDEKTARTIAFSLKDYSHFDHAYASTVHKLQGANFDHTDYLLSFNSNRYLEHVGMTRHKKSLNIHYSKEQFRKGYDTVQTFFGREAIKDMTVDYTGPEDIDSSLIDIESQLAQTVNQDVVDDWLDAVDFAALEKADCEALTPLLNAKAQYDNVSQHYAKESEAYRMAQANLVATALALRDNAQRQAILANIDAAQVTALTAHPLLNNLVQPRREVANGITAPDENFHAFLSSFDWKSIEQHKAEHIVLQDLFETKLAYEAAIVAHQHNALRTVADRDFKYEKAVAKELQSPDVTKERTTLLEILDVVANNETVHAQVTAIDNSIVEPLAEFKAMQERQELAKEVATLAQAAAYAENQSPQPPAPSMSPSETPNNEEKKSLPTKEPSFRKDFEAWYQSVDWNSIAEQKGYRFENLNSAVTLYEKVKTGDNLAATKRTEEKIIQRCALILEKTSKAELAQSLSPSAFNALTHYELEFKHERERHQHHSREISR